eukprot:TRINITY_DN4866_c0_g1_i1.p1 TRINITY_DN4866_c0_g1~~TRINITY_DN4866_c0_g1_i1.p1  ORF type:complete len:171 (+),score=59.05 TRINITY_DN4866_c0_g1_i1:66-578(+)
MCIRDSFNPTVQVLSSCKQPVNIDNLKCLKDLQTIISQAVALYLQISSGNIFSILAIYREITTIIKTIPDAASDCLGIGSPFEIHPQKADVATCFRAFYLMLAQVKDIIFSLQNFDGNEFNIITKAQQCKPAFDMMFHNCDFFDSQFQESLEAMLANQQRSQHVIQSNYM